MADRFDEKAREIVVRFGVTDFGAFATAIAQALREVEQKALAVRKEDAAFLNQVADIWSRNDGDAPGNESIWALKLREIATRNQC